MGPGGGVPNESLEMTSIMCFRLTKHLKTDGDTLKSAKGLVRLFMVI